MTTPTSHLPHLMKLAQIVTTSTPTHAAANGWPLFADQGADSPLSEIENTESPAQSMNNEVRVIKRKTLRVSKIDYLLCDSNKIDVEVSIQFYSSFQPSKTEQDSVHPKLKSIIVPANRTRIGSQDSSEKHVTFQDSNEVSSKTKKVKFADDTVFEQARVKRGKIMQEIK